MNKSKSVSDTIMASGASAAAALRDRATTAASASASPAFAAAAGAASKFRVTSRRISLVCGGVRLRASARKEEEEQEN